MTADFNKPIAEDQFLDVLAEIRDNLSALAKQDLSDAQNLPEGAIQFSSENLRWEKRMGAVWEALSPLNQTLDVKVHDSERLGDKGPDYYRNADNINAGTLDVSRLDTESASYDSANTTKIARISAVRALYNWIRNQISTHTHTAQQISGILAQVRIPNLPAHKITSGVLPLARIPNLPASRITSGLLSSLRIPDATIRGRLLNWVTHTGAGEYEGNIPAGTLYFFVEISGGGGGGAGGGGTDGNLLPVASGGGRSVGFGTIANGGRGGTASPLSPTSGLGGKSSHGAQGGAGGFVSYPSGDERGESGESGSLTCRYMPIATLTSSARYYVTLGAGGVGGGGMLPARGGRGADGYVRIWFYS